jgi:hypothetical protein
VKPCGCSDADPTCLHGLLGADPAADITGYEWWGQPRVEETNHEGTMTKPNEIDYNDERMTPHDLLVQMGLREQVSPLVSLIQTNRDRSAIVELVVELAMVIGARAAIVHQERQQAFNRVREDLLKATQRLTIDWAPADFEKPR